MKTNTADQNRFSYRPWCRTLVALAVTALIATALSLTAPTANAAAKNKRFAAPTSFTVAKATCVETSPNHWSITVTYKVSGGRYSNLGNPAKGITYGDNVYRGGTRYVSATEDFHGFPNTGGPDAPVTLDFTFSQMIAPIGKVRNHSQWKSIQDRPIITFTCN